jgi:hypothetical protein
VKLAFLTALVGFILLACATINSMGKIEQTSHDVNCLKGGIDAEVRSLEKQGFWAADPYRFNSEHCATSRTSQCGSTPMFIIGAILSFCANVLYALMWWDERRHSRMIEREVMKG